MDVSENSGTLKIIHFIRVFHYKPSILGYPYFWKHPYICTWQDLLSNLWNVLINTCSDLMKSGALRMVIGLEQILNVKRRLE